MSQASTDLVARWRDGDQNAARDLYQRYVERLSGIVTAQLSDRLRARADADDVLQSACRSFFRRVQDGQFQFDEDEDVWKLLVTISLNKLRSQVRKHSAAKRNAAQEISRRDNTLPDDFHLEKLSESPSPVEAFIFAEMIERVCENLDNKHAMLLGLRMEGYSQQEIAEQLQTSDRSIRRMLDNIRQVLSRELETAAN
ncbi:MAG: sigma-70 family RNA polymerase sigma factor [Planctomycetaceae bacterium]|nr:sigma-70 family RNA polymerase sigma factor [Planctomycetaceae bacterium]